MCFQWGEGDNTWSEKPEKDSSAVWTVPPRMERPSESGVPRDSLFDMASSLRRAEELRCMTVPGRRPNMVVMLWRGHLVWFFPFDQHGYDAAMQEKDEALITKVRMCMPKRSAPEEFPQVVKRMSRASKFGRPAGVWLVWDHDGENRARKDSIGNARRWCLTGEYPAFHDEPAEPHPTTVSVNKAVSAGDNDRQSKPAMAAAEVDFWLVDTGSGHDLASAKHIQHTQHELSTREVAMWLSTANGTTQVKEDALIDIHPLGETMDALVLDNTPPVLSVGKRVVRHGYSFIWIAGGMQSSSRLMAGS